jgi:hypothetical protein
MFEAREREAVANPVGVLRDLADSLSDWSEAFESPQPDHDGWALTFWIAKELLRDCIGVIEAAGGRGRND